MWLSSFWTEIAIFMVMCCAFSWSEDLWAQGIFPGFGTKHTVDSQAAVEPEPTIHVFKENSIP